MIEYYPDWLGPDIIAGSLPWEQALTTTVSSFLSQYSLHDSYWIGLYLESQRNGLVIIRWDTFWTEGKVPYPGSAVAEWPLLIWRLSRLQQVDIALVEDGIAGASSELLAELEREKRLLHTEVDLYYTQIEDHSGGIAHLIHDPAVAILCFDRNRNILEIPFKVGAR